MKDNLEIFKMEDNLTFFKWKTISFFFKWKRTSKPKLILGLAKFSKIFDNFFIEKVTEFEGN
jgi:hypothetical protein